MSSSTTVGNRRQQRLRFPLSALEAFVSALAGAGPTLSVRRRAAHARLAHGDDVDAGRARGVLDAVGTAAQARSGRDATARLGADFLGVREVGQARVAQREQEVLLVVHAAVHGGRREAPPALKRLVRGGVEHAFGLGGKGRARIPRRPGTAHLELQRHHTLRASSRAASGIHRLHDLDGLAARTAAPPPLQRGAGSLGAGSSMAPSSTAVAVPPGVAWRRPGYLRAGNGNGVSAATAGVVASPAAPCAHAGGASRGRPPGQQRSVAAAAGCPRRAGAPGRSGMSCICAASQWRCCTTPASNRAGHPWGQQAPGRPRRKCGVGHDAGAMRCTRSSSTPPRPGPADARAHPVPRDRPVRA